MSPGADEFPVIEEVEAAQLDDADVPRGEAALDDTDARASFAQAADLAWGTGDAAGQAWEAPTASSDAWVPTINPWALHQSDEIADWLRRKAEDVADDLAKMPERMKAAVNKAPETREKLRHVENHYTASLQRQLAHIDRLRAMTGDATVLEAKGQDVNDDTKGQKPKARGPLLNHEKAAAYLGFGPRKLQGMRNSPEGNKGPTYVLMGGSIFYDVDDLDAYVESQKVRSIA